MRVTAFRLSAALSLAWLGLLGPASGPARALGYESAQRMAVEGTALSVALPLGWTQYEVLFGIAAPDQSLSVALESQPLSHLPTLRQQLEAFHAALTASGPEAASAASPGTPSAQDGAVERRPFSWAGGSGELLISRQVFDDGQQRVTIRRWIFAGQVGDKAVFADANCNIGCTPHSEQIVLGVLASLQSLDASQVRAPVDLLPFTFKMPPGWGVEEARGATNMVIGPRISLPPGVDAPAPPRIEFTALRVGSLETPELLFNTTLTVRQEMVRMLQTQPLAPGAVLPPIPTVRVLPGLAFQAIETAGGVGQCSAMLGAPADPVGADPVMAGAAGAMAPAATAATLGVPIDRQMDVMIFTPSWTIQVGMQAPLNDPETEQLFRQLLTTIRPR